MSSLGQAYREVMRRFLLRAKPGDEVPFTGGMMIWDGEKCIDEPKLAAALEQYQRDYPEAARLPRRARPPT